MNDLLGLSLIGSRRADAHAATFLAENPATGEFLDPVFYRAGPEDVAEACQLSHQAFGAYSRSSPSQRAAFLRTIGQELEAGAAAIIRRAGLETALPDARLNAELGRTVHQLNLFAGVVEEGSWSDARIDMGDPDRKPLPKPDVRSMRRAVGPVAVFGAVNFPLAFSVAGGDTASALAAGNPVIVKAHPAHPGTSELVGRAVQAAVERCGLPAGTFSLLFDEGFAVARALVANPRVQAVGFTGSRGGGEALARLAAERSHPIPVYAEMGSVNPVLLFPGALHARTAAISEGLHASFTQGVGQFCTNPGVVLTPAGAVGDAFAERLAALTRSTPAGIMLTAQTCANYELGLERLRVFGAELLAEGAKSSTRGAGRATLWQVAASAALAEPRLLHEVFGPSTLLVRFADAAELAEVVRSLEGNLTATVHGLIDELAAHAPILETLAGKVGRLVFDQFPTGVEVNHAMVHGGPFPATSDGRSTSVGTRAIERFTRLVAFQNFPDQALPEELRDANPRAVLRLVNGVPTRDPVGRSPA